MTLTEFLQFGEVAAQWWGAILSTCLLIWTVRSRGKVRLECSERHSVNTVYNNVEEDVIIWQMTNIGSKPVLVTKVGGYRKDGEGFWIPDDELPKPLLPTEYHITICRNFGDLVSVGVRSFVAIDTLGRKYRASKKDVKKVNAFLKRMREMGQTSSITLPIAAET
jgi:hypothetical protein